MYKGKYLIIAGISKAGTTSLFDYLTEHPDVKGSYIKQTFFFLDKELQNRLKLKSVYSYDDGLDVFEKYFYPDNTSIYRLEATPDYLYSPNTPNRIKEFLDSRSGTVIFILRDPVSRFISFFYYGKQQGLIPKDLSLQGFFEKASNYTDNANPCLMAYSTGFYFSNIKSYIDILGAGRVKVLFFEDLAKDPKAVMKRLAVDLNIDESFYESYDFEVKNRTIEVRSHFLGKVYSKSREWYIDRFYKNRSGILVARILKATLSKAYKKINFASLKQEEHDHQVIRRLRKEYEEDIRKLEALVKVKTGWV